MQIKRSSHAIQLRNNHGDTLVSLLVATVLGMFIAAGIMGLSYLNWYSNTRAVNKSDSINAARTCIDELGHSLRVARSVGTVFGDVNPAPAGSIVPAGAGASTTPPITLSNAPPVTNVTTASNDFPASTDPFYSQTGNGLPGVPHTPPGGWPTGYPGWAPDAGVANGAIYRSSQTCLIVQIPIFDANGVPLATVNPPVVGNLALVDTVVYRVIPDTAADATPGTYMMQRCTFPAQIPAAVRPAGYVAPNSRPQTIVRGITGPMDPTTPGQFRIFQYISRTQPQNMYFALAQPGAGAPNSVENISGVSVNLEVLRKLAGQTNQASLQFKSDVYLRNNTSFTN